MRKVLKASALIIAVFMLMTAFAATALAAEPVSVFEYQKGVGTLCNNERVKEKRQALKLDLELNEIALKLAMEQEGYAGEKGYREDGSKWTTILLDSGYSYVEAGYIVVASEKSLTASALVEKYMNDSARRSNVMYPRFTHTGLNVYHSEKDAAYYYVQIFTLPVSDQAQAPVKGLYQATANVNVNVRAGAGVNFEVVGSLGKRQVVSVVSSDGKWSRILWNNSAYAYVYSIYLTPFSDSMVKAKANVNAREGAGANYKKLGQMKKGSEALLLGFSGEWAEIVWKDGTKAYVHKDYLSY